MAFLETKQDYRQIILKKLEFCRTRLIPKQDFEIELSDWDYILNGMKLQLREEIWTERLQDTAHELKFEVSYPATWWQHFKQMHFPKWLLKRFKIQWKTVSQIQKIQFIRSAAFPEFRYESLEEERPFVIKEGLEHTENQGEVLSDRQPPSAHLLTRTVEDGKVTGTVLKEV